jgi:hypothetical protein
VTGVFEPLCPPAAAHRGPLPVTSKWAADVGLGAQIAFSREANGASSRALPDPVFLVYRPASEAADVSSQIESSLRRLWREELGVRGNSAQWEG